jgi:hypothetical protein
LKCREFTIADAIRGDLETVFGKRNQPTHDDYGEQGRVAVLQVTVPRNCHEDVGTNKKQNGSHGAQIVSPVNQKGWVPVAIESDEREK